MKLKWVFALLAAFVSAVGCSSSSVRGDAGDGGDAPLADGDADRAVEASAPEVGDGPGPEASDAPEADGDTTDAEAGACPRWTGDRQFGTADDDAVLALGTSSRGVVAGGYLGGKLAITDIEPAGNARGFVRALSLAGETRWEATVDATATETIDALVIDGGDGVAVAGRTTGAFPGFTNKGQQDAFVAWLSPDGVLGPARQFGDERPQHPRRVILTPTGVAVGGFDDIFIDQGYVASWENPFFATVDATPAALPVFRPDRTTQGDAADGIALDPLGSGDLFLAGIMKEGAQRGLFVRRFAADGTLRWQTRLSTIGLEVPGPMLALSDGTLWLAAAWFRATSTTDVVLLRVDAATGALVKAFDFPSANAIEEVGGLVRDARGDFWIAGSADGPAFAGATPGGSFDPFVFHVGADGAFLGGWQRGTSGYDLGTALAVDACGNVIVGGSTAGALVAGATPLGGADAFVLRVPLLDVRP